MRFFAFLLFPWKYDGLAGNQDKGEKCVGRPKKKKSDMMIVAVKTVKERKGREKSVDEAETTEKNNLSNRDVKTNRNM